MSWFPFWPLLGLLAVAALLPLAANLFGPPRARGRREADLALYRAQLAELEREKEAGRLDEPAYRAAMLEVQRRLLAAPEERGAAATGRGRWATVAALVAVPALALGLYLPWAGLDVPSAPYALRQEAAARDEQVLGQLRARLAQLPPASEQARQGWVLLGNAERSRGRLDAAAQAYRQALAGRFDPELMGMLALVLLEDDKATEAEAVLDTLRRRLAELPAESEQARAGWAMLGDTERSRGRLEAAAEAYRHALAGGFSAQLTTQLAQVLLEEGKAEEASALLAAALPQAPQNIGLRFLAGQAEAQAGRTEAAKATWRALIADAPPDAPWRAMVERRMEQLP